MRPAHTGRPRRRARPGVPGHEVPGPGDLDQLGALDRTGQGAPGRRSDHHVPRARPRPPSAPAIATEGGRRPSGSSSIKCPLLGHERPTVAARGRPARPPSTPWSGKAGPELVPVALGHPRCQPSHLREHFSEGQQAGHGEGVAHHRQGQQAVDPSRLSGVQAAPTSTSPWTRSGRRSASRTATPPDQLWATTVAGPVPLVVEQCGGQVGVGGDPLGLARPSRRSRAGRGRAPGTGRPAGRSPGPTTNPCPVVRGVAGPSVRCPGR